MPLENKRHIYIYIQSCRIFLVGYPSSLNPSSFFLIVAHNLCEGIISSEPALQVSRSLPDLTSLDTTDELSGGFLLGQLYDDLKKRQNASRRFEKTVIFLTLLQQLDSIQFAIKSLREFLGIPHPECTAEHGSTFEDDEYFWSRKFFKLLEEVNDILEKRQVLLHPEETVKQVGSLVLRLKRDGRGSVWTTLHYPNRRQYILKLRRTDSSSKNEVQEFVNTLIGELKEMAALLVKIFKLDPKLLKGNTACNYCGISSYVQVLVSESRSACST